MAHGGHHNDTIVTVEKKLKQMGLLGKEEMLKAHIR